MKARKKLLTVLGTILCIIMFQMVVYGAQWKSENGYWYYEENGVRRTGWINDGTGDYYLNGDGSLKSGWHFEKDIWYFLNTVKDGYYGRAFANQWLWVDGYCYCFDGNGKMYANTTTPDGYQVNKDGQWSVNGTVQYIASKGILTSGNNENGSTLNTNRTPKAGWYKEGDIWYFLKPSQNNGLGVVIKNQWEWIDGYCYCFDSDGKMYANTTTPEGYQVNGDGRWIVNGVIQYVPGKGILTAQLTSGTVHRTDKTGGGSGSSGGGSGSSGGGSGSSGGGSGSSGGGSGSSGGGSGSSGGGSGSSGGGSGSSGGGSGSSGGGSGSSGGGSGSSGGGSGSSGGGSGSSGGGSGDGSESPDITFDEKVSIVENVDFTINNNDNTVTMEDSQITSQWEVGEIYILTDENNPEKNTPIKVTSIDISGAKPIVHFEQPQLTEIFDYVELSENINSGGTFTPASDVTIVPVTRSRAVYEDSMFKEYGLNYEKGDVTFSGILRINSLKYRFVIDSENYTEGLSEATIELDADFTASAFSSKKNERTIPIGEISLRTIGLKKVPVDIKGELFLVFDSEGEATLTVSLKHDSEVNYNIENDPKVHYDSNTYIDVNNTNLKMSGSCSEKLNTRITLYVFGQEIAVIGGVQGVALEGDAEVYSDPAGAFCLEAHLYDVNQYYTKFLPKVKNRPSYFDSNDNLDGGIFDAILHIEENGVVDTCTRNHGVYYGLVTDAITGNPIPNASVTLTQESSGSEVIRRVYTNENGQFKDDQPLGAGKYTLCVTADNYLSSETVILIKKGQETEKNFVLNPKPLDTGTFEGNVSNSETLAAISGAKVEIFDLNSDKIVTTLYTDEYGAFNVDTIEVGTYRLQVIATDYEVYTTTISIEEQSGEMLRVLLTPLSSDNELQIDIYFENGGYNTYLQDVTLEIVNQETGKTIISAKTDEGGSYRGKAPEAGTYTVLASLKGFHPLTKTITLDRKDAAYEWEMEQRFGFWGYIEYTREGNTYHIPNAVVKCTASEGKEFTATTDEDGYYELDLEPGKYTLTCEAVGYYDNNPYTLEVKSWQERNKSISIDYYYVDINLTGAEPLEKEGRLIEISAADEQTRVALTHTRNDYFSDSLTTYRAFLPYGKYNIEIARVVPLDSNTILTLDVVTKTIMLEDQESETNQSFTIELKEVSPDDYLKTSADDSGNGE